MSYSLSNAPNLGVVPSASEVIAKYLRNAIISGEIAEDEPIRQDEIAKSFNVSKIPVREALKRLEAEGLVEFQRNRGAMVTRISEAELAQIFEVRVLLEVEMTRLAVPNFTDKDYDKAIQILDDFLVGEDVGRWAEMNWAFHACIYEAAQRPFMFNMIRSIHDKVERYLRMQMVLSEGKATADAEHRAILAACKAHDVALATRLIEEHIHSVCKTLFEHLPKPRNANVA
ncbi:MAG: GntR family transcriptional regulator [Pseudomonas sp.]